MARDEELPENVELDSEGIPPLEGALPERKSTDDPQEGIWPPRDHRLSDLAIAVVGQCGRGWLRVKDLSSSSAPISTGCARSRGALP